MKLRFRQAIFSVICGLFLLLAAASAQNSEIVFPEVDGWEKGEITKYPTAELGYSIPYQSETGGIVTFYVYNGGLSKIANGIDDINVKNEIKKAEADVKAYGDAGYYQDVKLITSKTVKLGGDSGTTDALYTLLTFKVRGAEVDSEIYLLGFQNNFIKIRATRAKGKNGAENSEVNKLLMEVGEIF
ncbi:MAG: hypothetical protein KDB79_14195, partial [Acidobacteria bacterium]|nr:hypothetical protein [Acidobacteriota bacterium]